ncbi:hypothetical protein ACTTAI_19330 [Rhodobacter capsulatus]|uniref:hypothetical protein n=1 Tax=Rhodobacter capsulatus TaxID=1061 RepID=UPI0040257A48
MRKRYRATEVPTLTRRGARRSAARAALRRLRKASDALDDSVAGDVLGAVSLLVTMISGLWLAYGVFG